MTACYYVPPRVRPQPDRCRRRRAGVVLGVMGLVVTQLAWGCHLPEPTRAGTAAVARASVAGDESAIRALAGDESAIRALIASAFCDTSDSPQPVGKTAQSSLCLHCTTGSENLSVERQGSPWSSERLAINLSPRERHPIVSVGRTPPARGPPKSSS